MRNLLLVDYSNIIMRGAAVNASLKDYQGNYTGGLFGFMSQLSTLINKYKITDILVCKDCPPYHRKERDADYKGGRDPKVKDAEDDTLSLYELRELSRPLCDELLEHLKAAVWGVTGYEADDLMVQACLTLQDDFDTIVVASNDSDMDQIFAEPTKVIQARQKGAYTHESYLAQYGELPVDDWLIMMAMQGTHNNVVGIPRIGEKTSLKLVKEKSRKYHEVCEKNADLINKNKELIQLPWKGIEEHEIPDYTCCKNISERPLLKFFTKYDITVTAAMHNAIERLSL